VQISPKHSQMRQGKLLIPGRFFSKPHEYHFNLCRAACLFSALTLKHRIMNDSAQVCASLLKPGQLRV
jgi:hypothetical protein